MRLFFALLIVVLAGCAGRPAARQAPFVYPPPPGAPQVIDVSWPDLLVVIKSGHGTAAHERHRPHVWQVSVETDDGHVYRATEPRPFAIYEAVEKNAPQAYKRWHIDVDYQDE